MKVGRPTKMTKELITALNEVAEEALYCTDEDLVFLLNEKLSENQQITIDTFRSYKNGRNQKDNELITEFIHVIKKVLIQEKNNLLKLVKKGDNGWQSKSWILERKFDEWNLKRISDIKIDNVPDIVFKNASNTYEIDKNGNTVLND